jgi:hypothetical protein
MKKKLIRKIWLYACVNSNSCYDICIKTNKLKSHSSDRWLSFSLRKSEVLADRTFDLHLHLILHFSFGISSVAINNDDIEQD